MQAIKQYWMPAVAGLVLLAGLQDFDVAIITLAVGIGVAWWKDVRDKCLVDKKAASLRVAWWLLVGVALKMVKDGEVASAVVLAVILVLWRMGKLSGLAKLLPKKKSASSASKFRKEETERAKAEEDQRLLKYDAEIKDSEYGSDAWIKASCRKILLNKWSNVRKNYSADFETKPKKMRLKWAANNRSQIVSIKSFPYYVAKFSANVETRAWRRVECSQMPSGAAYRAHEEIDIWSENVGDVASTFEHKQCETCHDKHSIECPDCHGNKTVTCPDCGGKPDSTCPACHGEKTHWTCRTCHGESSWTCHECGGDPIHECHECHGKGEMRCECCHGRGWKECQDCHGSGEVKCTHCNGTGQDKCPVCKGVGSVKEKVYVYNRNCPVCNGTGREYGYSKDSNRKCAACNGSGKMRDERFEDKACPNCHGKRTDTCENCHGTGYTKCTSCHGKGDVHCGNCDGSGIAKCGTCGGTGKEHCKMCDGTGKEHCKTCGGSGQEHCQTCAGEGVVHCGTCSRKGVVNCKKCKGAGKIVCPTCKGVVQPSYIWRIESNDERITILKAWSSEDADKTNTQEYKSIPQALLPRDKYLYPGVAPGVSSIYKKESKEIGYDAGLLSDADGVVRSRLEQLFNEVIKTKPLGDNMHVKKQSLEMEEVSSIALVVLQAKGCAESDDDVGYCDKRYNCWINLATSEILDVSMQ